MPLRPVRVPPRLRRACLALVVLLVGTALSACGSDASTGDKGYVDGEGIITRLPVDERRKPGPVAGKTLEGRELDLKQYVGRVVVLNVWGSWCPPCRSEATALAGASRDLTASGVAFVGINAKDSGTDQGKAFQRHYDVPYPSLYDPSGRMCTTFAGADRPPWAAHDPTDAELRAAYNNTVVYCARYEVDAGRGVITFHLDLGLNPGPGATRVSRLRAAMSAGEMSADDFIQQLAVLQKSGRPEARIS